VSPPPHHWEDNGYELWLCSEEFARGLRDAACEPEPQETADYLDANGGEWVAAAIEAQSVRMIEVLGNIAHALGVIAFCLSSGVHRADPKDKT
jgi:hypothetical protein